MVKSLRMVDFRTLLATIGMKISSHINENDIKKNYARPPPLKKKSWVRH